MSTIKEKIISESHSPYIRWRVFSIIIVGVMGASIILSLYFVYQNIYRTLEDANVILILNSTSNVDTINFVAFQKASDLVQMKSTPIIIPDKIRNIFDYVTTPSPAVPTSTSSSTKP